MQVLGTADVCDIHEEHAFQTFERETPLKGIDAVQSNGLEISSGLLAIMQGLAGLLPDCDTKTPLLDAWATSN